MEVDAFEIWIDPAFSAGHSLFLHFPSTGLTRALDWGEEVPEIPKGSLQLISANLVNLQERGNGEHAREAEMVNTANKRVNEIVDRALEAFWEKVNEALPPEEGQELDAQTGLRLKEMARIAVIRWVFYSQKS